MKKYDVIIVGASTTGSWFGCEMAKRGFKVLMLEKQERENVSRSYDIFHMAKKEMEKFGYPIPKPGDEDYSFEFDGGCYYSAYGNYPKPSRNIVIGMRKHRYILRLNDNAVEAGAELIYGASFSDFIFDAEGKIVGAKYQTADGEHEALAAIVADCSGIPSVARRALPDGINCENFEISPRDMLFSDMFGIQKDTKRLFTPIPIFSTRFGRHRRTTKRAAFSESERTSALIMRRKCSVNSEKTFRGATIPFKKSNAEEHRTDVRRIPLLQTASSQWATPPA